MRQQWQPQADTRDHNIDNGTGQLVISDGLVRRKKSVLFYIKVGGGNSITCTARRERTRDHISNRQSSIHSETANPFSKGWNRIDCPSHCSRKNGDSSEPNKTRHLVNIHDSYNAIFQPRR